LWVRLELEAGSGEKKADVMARKVDICDRNDDGCDDWSSMEELGRCVVKVDGTLQECEGERMIPE
jgi:hypothetical protein